jgi:hypothetical protein
VACILEVEEEEELNSLATVDSAFKMQGTSNRNLMKQ